MYINHYVYLLFFFFKEKASQNGGVNYNNYDSYCMHTSWKTVILTRLTRTLHGWLWTGARNNQAFTANIAISYKQKNLDIKGTYKFIDVTQ